MDMLQRPRIALITTGGTIGEGAAFRTERAHSPGRELLAHIEVSADVTVQDLLDLPSTFIAPAEMLRIRDGVEEALASGADAIVVTHGTDTLEESAFALDLLHTDPRPVLFTGAMRPIWAADTDGFRNLGDAVSAALSPDLRELGVLVVFHGEIHAARAVTKYHTMALNAFQSPGDEPLGTIKSGQVRLARRPPRGSCLPQGRGWVEVDLLKCCAGMQGRAVRDAVEAGVGGLVIEALGSGQVPPAIMEAVEDAIASGIAVVVTPRCPTGALARPVKGQESQTVGDEHQLRRAGAIFSDLSGQKARIQLGLCLGAGLAARPLREQIEATGGKQREQPA